PVHPETRPYIVKQAHDWAMKILEATNDSLTEAEARYLRSVHSEMHIPVFHGSKVGGVIVVISQTEAAFRDEVLAAVERVMHAVSIWWELAHRHDGQRWVESALRSATIVLPLLPTAQSDDAFYAGLPPVLSAHCGLRWNRVFIYSCACNAPASAELVYALGG